MKRRIFHRIIDCLAVLALAATTARAADDWTRYDARFSGSNVRIEGTSTIHDWHVEGKIIGGSMEFDPSFPATPETKVPEKLAATPKVQAVIPVTSLKSSSGKLMDDVMYKAMNKDDHPRIYYRLTEMNPNLEASQDGAAVFDTKGELAVSGVTNVIAMPVTVTHVDGNKLKVVGSTNLKMTDFGIKPPAPKLALGAIKTGDDVKITFEWMAEHKTKQAQ